MEFENAQGMGDDQVQGDSGQQEPVETQQGTQQDLVDLDGIERFKWGGQEWTPKDLQGAILRQSDYTRKTQALAEQRKEFDTNKRYYDNLQADLEAVKADPALAEKFRQVYPEGFHKFLGYVSGQSSTPAQKPQESSAASALPKDVVDRLSRIDHLEGQVTKMTQAQREREITAINAELDNVCKTMSEKYPFADEGSVLARAEALARQGQKMTTQVWDDLWSSANKRTEELFKKRYSEQVNKQSQANKAGADASPGGAIPGQKPVKARSIKEMTNQLFESGMVG